MIAWPGAFFVSLILFDSGFGITAKWGRRINDMSERNK